jgi:hypothetical protein
MIPGVRIRVEMKPQGSENWELLGTYTANDAAELAVLRSILHRHENPVDALKELPPGLIYDLIDVVRLEGHQARISFVEEH